MDTFKRPLERSSITTPLHDATASNSWRARLISRVLPHRPSPARKAPRTQAQRPDSPPTLEPGISEGCPSARMRRLTTWTEFTSARENRERGAFYWSLPDERFGILQLWLVLPNGTSSCVCIEPMPAGFQRRSARGLVLPPAWAWDGHAEEPTLCPSLRHGHSGDRWYWHGQILAGVMKGE